ncbi:efflux RND transporter permease subunit [Leptospira meyeri]|uniref:efflux RND transporter permease subunit n=1 Tax=Leptospira meyeri TaxID=29508 RepID=UPI0002BEF68E|nr:efflux RND transporter permease subunit [Leptospira meyeri]EMJ90320.1 RND transporter, Hydrophobe/Amphiphile Efflux-1 (HAE1)/Heavy Metal Efflux (HME) family, permease protein [Leptospira meyeri serovar Semaranga str. Veldrot Semarang 173]
MKLIVQIILKRKMLVGMFYAAFVLFGIIRSFSIPVSLFPKIDFPRLTIITAFNNASSAEVDSLVTKRISESLGTTQKLERLEAESREGYSFVHLTFKNGTDLALISMELREKLDFIKDTLPFGTEKPIISKFDPSSKPLMQIAFSSKGKLDQDNLRIFLLENAKFYFDRLDGVALTQIIGGKKRRISIIIDPLKLSAYGVQPEELDQLVKISNKNYPAGQLSIGKKELLIRAVGEFQNLEHLSNLVVSFRQGSGVIKLGDISHLVEEFDEKTGFARLNGKDSVLLNIYKEPGKNSVSISEEIKKSLIELKKSLGRDLDFEIIYNESDFIENSISSLLQNLFIGASLAFTILLILMRNAYSPFILILTIPVTLFLSFFIFYISGIGFNIMSLGGLALGIGLLFDSSNVVLSAIERRIKENEKLENAIPEGVAEVFESILTATATSVIVFLPIGFLKSLLGLVFAEMALAISVTLIISFFVSCTFVPLIVAILYKKRNLDTIQSIGIVEIIAERYSKYLNSFLDRPAKSILGILIAFIVSLALIPYLKFEFFPEIHSGIYNVSISAPAGTNLFLLDETVSIFEKKLKAEYPNEIIVTKGGIEKDLIKWDSEESSKSNYAEIKLIGGQLHTFDNLREVIETIPSKEGYTVLFSEESSGLEKLLFRTGNENSILLLSGIKDTLPYFANSLKSSYKKKIITDFDQITEEYWIDFDQEKMAKFGFTSEGVASFIKIALKGIETSEMNFGNQSLKLIIRMDKNKSDTIEKLSFLRLKSPSGDFVPLRELCQIRLSEGEQVIRRYSNLYATKIRVPFEENREEIEKDVQKKLKINKEIFLKKDGDSEDLNESLVEVLTAFLFAALLIFMLLSGIFESYRSAIIVMLSIPLIFIGVFPSLFVSSMSLNISSFMGFILVIGVVVDNSVLYFEYYHFYLETLKDKKLALLRAGKTIIRPVLMNNSTTILGMLPVLFSFSSGSEFQAPLALVVVTGLLSSLLLSLFIIPASIFFLPVAEKRND